MTFGVQALLTDEHVIQGAPCLRVLQLASEGFQGSLHNALAAKHERRIVSPVPDNSLPRARQMPHQEIHEEALANSCMRKSALLSYS